MIEKRNVPLSEYCYFVDDCLKKSEVLFVVRDGWLNLNIYGRDKFVRMAQQKARDGVKISFLTQNYVVERKGKTASEILLPLIEESHRSFQFELAFLNYTKQAEKVHCIIADNKLTIVESLHYETDDNRSFRLYDSPDIASAFHYCVVNQICKDAEKQFSSNDYTIVDDFSYRILKWRNDKFKQKEFQYAEKNPFKWLDDVVSDTLSAIRPAQLEFYKEWLNHQIKSGPRKYEEGKAEAEESDVKSLANH